MAEVNEHITLSELNNLIGRAIATQLRSSYWIVAEVVELRENYSGHCYLVLADKEGDKVISQSRASIWQQTYRMIKPYFESTTGLALASGIKIRIKVAVSYHNVYGLNLTVQDIDPAYTVGELTVRRQQILNQLEEEGVSEMNKELELPLAPQRIAVISSPTAAGYGDFVNQLSKNSFHYKFQVTLFPAIMQGDKAEQSIIKAMEKVYDELADFDVLVIIRGGGAVLDLSCFDNYNLAYYITQFPLPLIVGIGHERDETVLDFVAHTALKTPTAVAAFLIERLQLIDVQVDELVDRLQLSVHQIVLREKQHIQGVITSLPLIGGRVFTEKSIQLNEFVHAGQHFSDRVIQKHDKQIDHWIVNTKSVLSEIFLKRRQILEKAQILADLSNPEHQLKKGYSLVFKEGQLVKSSSQVEKNDMLTSVFYDGEILSEVK